MSSGPARILLNEITVNQWKSTVLRSYALGTSRIYAASYHKCDTSDDTKTKLRAADKRLPYPGTAPRAAQRAQAAARLSRFTPSFGVPVGQEDRNLSHHTPHRAGPTGSRSRARDEGG